MGKYFQELNFLAFQEMSAPQIRHVYSKPTFATLFFELKSLKSQVQIITKYFKFETKVSLLKCYKSPDCKEKPHCQ